LKQGRAFPSWCCSVPGRPCALAGAGDAGGETAFYSLPAPSLTGVSTAGEKLPLFLRRRVRNNLTSGS